MDKKLKGEGNSSHHLQRWECPCQNTMKERIIGIVQKYGENDIEFDYLELPVEVQDKIMELAEDYCGGSVRGTAGEVIADIRDYSYSA